MRAEYDCYAITAPGVEPVTARELAALGLRADGGRAGWGAPSARRPPVSTAANLELRTASRVLVRIGAFHASSFHELERRAKRLPWARFLGPGVMPEFRVTSRKSRLYHQEAVAKRLAELVGKGREQAGEGGSVRAAIRGPFRSTTSAPSAPTARASCSTGAAIGSTSGRRRSGRRSPRRCCWSRGGTGGRRWPIRSVARGRSRSRRRYSRGGWRRGSIAASRSNAGPSWMRSVGSG